MHACIQLEADRIARGGSLPNINFGIKVDYLRFEISKINALCNKVFPIMVYYNVKLIILVN